MSRRDYFDDPVAPTANSIVVATNAFVRDAVGQVLLVRRSDNSMWALPGGGLDIGESVASCAKRETFEETGYRIRVVGLVGVYSDPRHVIAYSNGEVRQEFALVLRGDVESGQARTSDETTQIEWVHPDDLSRYPMHPSVMRRVTDGFQTDEGPFIR